jgi:hypothetical protein
MRDAEAEGLVPVAAPRGERSSSGPHVGWCQFECFAALGGIEHLSRPQQWSPRYQHEVAVTAWLRATTYPEGQETPAAVLRVDNAMHPGEVAMDAEDLAVLAQRLLVLREALLTGRGSGL